MDLRIASRSALASSVGTQHHMLVSKTQANALRHACKDCARDLTAEAIASGVVEMSQLQWHDHQHMLFAAGPLNATADVMPKSQRRQMQDWSSLPSYFTSDMWEFLTNRSHCTASKLDAIVSFAVKGGLRLPSENTAKIMTGTWLVCTEGPSNFLSSEQKLVYLRHLKSAFHQQRKRVITDTQCAKPPRQT